MKRRRNTWKQFSAVQVQEIFEKTAPEEYAHGGLGGGEYMLPPAETLIRKSFRFVFDDHESLDYSFPELHLLRWSNQEKTQDVYYDAHEIEKGVFLIHHIEKESKPPCFRTLIADSNTGLVTLCEGHLGNSFSDREVEHTFFFGKIEGRTDYPEEMHHYTSDLVGKAINWTYRKGMFPVKHIYQNELYYTCVLPGKEPETDLSTVPEQYRRSLSTVWSATNPADYIKINDHLYVFSFIEERQAGVQGLFLINTETLHDVGCFTGINGQNVFECYTLGAKGEWSTMETHFKAEY